MVLVLRVLRILVLKVLEMLVLKECCVQHC
jgi:hypothetical protein